MNEYLRIIREMVGHIPILLCGASVIVRNASGEILLMRRNDDGLWAYPGGAVDLDEPVEQAAARELLEETGLKANNLTLFGVYSGKDMRHTYPNGDEVSIVDIVYATADYEGIPTPDNDESSELRFFPVHALPKDISRPCRRALGDYVASVE